MKKIFQYVHGFAGRGADEVTKTTKYRYRRIDTPDLYAKQGETNSGSQILYEHEDTGIVTADPFKFEKWLSRLGRTTLE